METRGSCCHGWGWTKDRGMKLWSLLLVRRETLRWVRTKGFIYHVCMRQFFDQADLVYCATRRVQPRDHMLESCIRLKSVGFDDSMCFVTVCARQHLGFLARNEKIFRRRKSKSSTAVTMRVDRAHSRLSGRSVLLVSSNVMQCRA